MALAPFVIAQTPTTSAATRRRGKKGGGNHQADPELPQSLASFAALSLVLGRVSDTSATLNLLTRETKRLSIHWGTKSDRLDQAKVVDAVAGTPIEVEFKSLRPDTRYFYDVRSTDRNEALRTGCQFHTQRKPGASFTFTVQGDSHPERPQMFDAALYAKTLQSIAADAPDFHICMGDDFSIAKLQSLTAASIASRYSLQRPFLGIVGQSAPVFLINGNHEQASLFNYNQKGEAHDAAVWAQQARNRYFSLPSPDDFFSGNKTPLEGIGSLRDYYAWTWGDALFVVLDNYWHSPACVDTRLNEDDVKGHGKDRDWWGITLGDEQYQWLAKVLSASNAKFKFVIAHHVLGTGRGGIERAPFYEWGGKGERGGTTFADARPNWSCPIHQLLVKNRVNIFFQGHDHLYARQELDGIVYQTVPVPADPNNAIYNEDRYQTGIKHPNSGYLRVTVNAAEAKVEYVRSYLNANAVNQRQGEITHSYTVEPRR